jgi:putative Mn2+ efflux pump MntP
VIFFGLGIRLLIKAWKNERVVEKREERPDWKRTVLHLAITSIYTFLTGVAFGFIGFHMATILIMIVCISVAVVLLGMYTGYRLGFEHKLQAYILGAMLLGVAGVDVIVRYIV